MANYIGETVTVFVESGGISGAGFTGILLFVNEVYIELLISIALPPACSLNNPCIYILSVHTVWDSLILISALWDHSP